MKKREWSEGIDHIDPALVEEYVETKDRLKKTKSRKGVWLRIGAIAACLVLIVGAIVIIPIGDTARYSAEDIAKALGWEIPGAVPEKMHFAPHEVTPKERSVYNVVADSSDGLTMDKIAEMTSLSVAEVSAILLNMELSGMVRQLPGKVYVIC